MIALCSPFSEIDIRKGELSIGSGFKMRSNCHLRVRQGGRLKLGRNVSLNYCDMIVCHKEVVIGDNVEFGPNVLIFDHDHDFRVIGGLKSKVFKKGTVVIGNNVWIGANSVILRNTTIGDNSVVAAGSVISGYYPRDSVIYQRKVTQVKPYILESKA